MHLAQRLLLKVRVANREDLVDDENFRIKMGCHGKCQPDIHAAAVPLHRGIKKSIDFGKGNDLVELPADLFPGHAENCPVQEDVLAPRQLGMKSGAYLEQTCHAAAHDRTSP